MFDVGVIGAGPAGMVAALAAARAGARVLLLDHAGQRRIDVGETLPPMATSVLRVLGLQALLEESLSRVFGVQSAWNDDAPVARDFLFGAHGPGWRLHRVTFQRELVGYLERQGVSCILQSAVLDLQLLPGYWVLKARKDDTLMEFRAGGLVDATGRSSHVARRQGVKRIQSDRLVGVLLEHRCADIDNGVVFVEATSYGWWYSARTSGDMRVFGMMTDTDILHTLGARSLPAWWRLLSETTLIRRVADSAPPAGRDPVIVPANSSRLEKYAGERWIAAGDAAIAFDPLSSQGVTTSLMTGHRAAISLLRQLNGGTKHHDDYVDVVKRVSGDYAASLAQHYQANLRFNSALFWQRRRA